MLGGNRCGVAVQYKQQVRKKTIKKTEHTLVTAEYARFNESGDVKRCNE